MSTSTSPLPVHLRAADAAAFLGVAESTFWRWAREGRLPKGVRLSKRCTVWPREALAQFVEHQASVSAGKEGA